ncbi:MAG: ABC transporter ATP-binding protein [Chloroflexi bacterium]|nr:ABC transporter ATP-binding protein [Chloroflexota bacterium]
MRVLGRVTALAWRHPVPFLLAYLCLLGATAFALLLPRLLGSAVDTAFLARSEGRLVVLALLIVLVGAMRGLLGYGQTYLGEWLSQRVAYELRNALFQKLERLSFGFHDQQQTGNLMSRATADVEGVRWFVSMGLLRAGQVVLLIGGAAALLFLLDVKLTAMALAFIPFAAWRTTVIARAMRRIWTQVQQLTGELTTVLQENLTGARVVRAFGAEEFEKRKFDATAREVASTSVEASRLQAVNSSQLTLAFTAATALVLWFGGRQVLAGTMTPGELAQFIFYLTILAMPVRMTGWVVNSLSRGVSSGERIFEVLDTRSPVRDRPGAHDLGRVHGHVRFENVSFSYNDGTGPPVLRDISFEARPGQVVALVGAPGSGKSTVVHLIPRFYDVTRGRVTIDGTDVRDVTLASLRRNVGIALQDVFLFSASIRENVAYGRPDIPFAQVVEAAKLAQLHDFVATLPQGYETHVGERGVTLSGGQRQRLAIARVLLLGPPILILDDSTSSVDAHTEHLLRQALAEVMKGRTTFVIANRLTTLQSADLVLVLQDGETVQRGTHAELVQQPGLYQDVYRLQLLPQEERVPMSAPGDGDGS